MTEANDTNAGGWALAVAVDRGNGTAMTIWYLAAIADRSAAIAAVQQVIRPIDKVGEARAIDASHFERRGMKPDEVRRLGDSRR